MGCLTDVGQWSNLCIRKKMLKKILKLRYLEKNVSFKLKITRITDEVQ